MTAIRSSLRIVWKSLTGISVMYPVTRAESGVASPATKASSVDSSRAAPVQRFQCPATYQISQAAATRNATRSVGNSHRKRPLGLGGLVTASLLATDTSLIESPAMHTDGL